MKICSYVMTSDTGFAPHPFYRYCTLAACTPNHQNANLFPDDWIAGFFYRSDAYYLVYVMKISEILDYNAYYRDPRFKRKKPNLQGTWRQRCGDNIYSRNKSGEWEQSRHALYHTSEAAKNQDTRTAIVFIGKDFTYFGGRAYEHKLPRNLHPMINLKNRGIKYTIDNLSLFTEFMSWIKSKPRGIQGNPRDRNVDTKCKDVALKQDCERGAKRPTKTCTPTG